MQEFRERDPFSPIAYVYPECKSLHQERSDHQEIGVLQHPYFGRMLVLDGVVQLTERDEFYYHEMLAHVPLHAHPQPRRVIVIGGGDGGTVREVVKHQAVEEIHLVELDPRVVEVSKLYFPAFAPAWASQRVRVVHEDGASFVREAPDGAAELIIVDSTDPVGPAAVLYTDAFLAECHRVLGQDGIFVCQSQSLFFHADFVADLQRRLKRIYPIVDLYTQPIATYAGNWWTFSIGSKGYDPRRSWHATGVATRHYSRDVHRQAFVSRSVYGRLLQGKLGT